MRPIVDVRSTDGHHRALPLCAILSTACKLSNIVLVIPKQGMKLVDEREELSNDGGGGGCGGEDGRLRTIDADGVKIGIGVGDWRWAGRWRMVGGRQLHVEV